MGQLILGITLFAVIFVIERVMTKSKKEANKHHPEPNKKYGENFPFPTPTAPPRTQPASWNQKEETEDWLGRKITKVDEKVPDKKAGNSKHKKALQKEFDKVITNSNNRIATEPSAAKFNEMPEQPYGSIIDDFDLTKAVIYSEIMEPKFKQY